MEFRRPDKDVHPYLRNGLDAGPSSGAQSVDRERDQGRRPARNITTVPSAWQTTLCACWRAGGGAPPLLRGQGDPEAHRQISVRGRVWIDVDAADREWRSKRSLKSNANRVPGCQRLESSFRTWITRVAVNGASMLYRRDQAKPPRQGLPDLNVLACSDERVDHSHIRDDRAQAVRQAVVGLPPKDRQALILRVPALKERDFLGEAYVIGGARPLWGARDGARCLEGRASSNRAGL